jgi:hypothetical protein
MSANLDLVIKATEDVQRVGLLNGEDAVGPQIILFRAKKRVDVLAVRVTVGCLTPSYLPATIFPLASVRNPKKGTTSI